MNANFKSNIYAITPLDGSCGVCEMPVKLTHADKVTRLVVGECCKTELWVADNYLELVGRKSGVCHPAP